MEENKQLGKNSQGEEKTNQIFLFVAEKLKSGIAADMVVYELEKGGLNKKEAQELVSSVESYMLQVAEQEKVTGQSLPMALLGGALAAVLGGLLWGLIVHVTGYEIGYMAWGIGWLCAYAILLFTRGKRGLVYQIIAVVSSSLGILIGKYIYFFYELKKVVVQKYGAEAFAGVSMFSEKVINIFKEEFFSMFSFFDVAWICLAFITAWSILNSGALKIQKAK